MRRLTSSIKERSRLLGFTLVGVAKARPSNHAHLYTQWLGKGYHAGMTYLARPDAVKKRVDPRRVLAETRSIITVGMNYYSGDFPPTDGLRGRVSRYAWSADYHGVMLDRLHRLAEWIDEQTEDHLAYRCYVDTGPLLERELAHRAGLGWVGKNTNLIHPRLGSYFFLGEVLVGRELEPDAPLAADRCGTCSACLDACPTGALVAPRTLDASRCISYLTIEHRGTIPEEARPMLHDWVFGCDICQEVCPWNQRFARPTEEPAFGPIRPTLDLAQLLTLDEHAFRARFRHTPLRRSRRAGLLRNAAVALGNLGGQSAPSPEADTWMRALERSLSDPEPLVAEHAAWALKQMRR